MQLHTIKNKNGLKAVIGGDNARLLSLLVPNNKGKLIDVVLGFDDAEDIRVWDVIQPDEHIVALNYTSKNSNEHCGGIFNIKLVYALNNSNCLKITYEATCNELLYLNPINRTFFNLNGCNHERILKHQLCIKADDYLPIDTVMKPTGHTESVAGSPFDFRKSAIIGSRINDHHWQLKNGNGYHHYFSLNRHAVRTPVAKLRGDISGIIMEVFTDAPKLHVCSNGPALALFAGDFHQTRQLLQYPFIALKPGQVYKFVCSYLFKN